MSTIISTAVIILIIAAYIGFVIGRYIKRAKNGKFCNCGCDNCSNKTKDCEYEMKNSDDKFDESKKSEPDKINDNFK